jgi:hypothetical protein
VSRTLGPPSGPPGGIVELQHLNICIDDQQLATAFYVVGMGFTRDPYNLVGLGAMWINVGQQQFHLPTTSAQVVRGTIDVIVPDLDELVERLTFVRPLLSGTRFDFLVRDGQAMVTCPWGNRFRAHPSGPGAEVTRGISSVEFETPLGTADGVYQFYTEIMDAPATIEDGVVRVVVGTNQTFVFRETTEPLMPYDGYHVNVYLSNFSTVHEDMRRRGLISLERDEFQFNFHNIIDPSSNELLLELEHEIRSIDHPAYLSPLVNRDLRPGRGDMLRTESGVVFV